MRKRIVVLYLIFSFNISNAQQIGNYVSNGSFEKFTIPQFFTVYEIADYWQPIDSNKFSYLLLSTLPPVSNAPNFGLGYQWARTGTNFIGSSFYYPSGSRGYPRNRLKKQLEAGKVYCAKYHIVNTNNSPIAIENYGMFFANALLDTISYCNIPLSYLSPQVEYASGVITDTLNWIPVTGTFVANGDEKYLVLGNFRSNAATNTVLNVPPPPSKIVNDVYIDDVSVIEFNLPAYAGPDKVVLSGDSAFIGREPDFAIDKGCIWYQLPGMMPIDTTSGLWVKPLVTTTYVVRQELECSPLKWDTVVVYMNSVGVVGFNVESSKFNIYPVPAGDFVELRVSGPVHLEEIVRIRIIDVIGECLKEEEIAYTRNMAKINTAFLPEGIYFLKIGGDTIPKITKRFVISR